MALQIKKMEPELTKNRSKSHAEKCEKKKKSAPRSKELDLVSKNPHIVNKNPHVD